MNIPRGHILRMPRAVHHIISVSPKMMSQEPYFDSSGTLCQSIELSFASNLWSLDESDPVNFSFLPLHIPTLSG